MCYVFLELCFGMLYIKFYFNDLFCEFIFSFIRKCLLELEVVGISFIVL